MLQILMVWKNDSIQRRKPCPVHYSENLYIYYKRIQQNEEGEGKKQKYEDKKVFLLDPLFVVWNFE